MSKNTVARLLSDPNKQISQTAGTDGMLARIFREFLISYKMTFDRWEVLIREYIRAISTDEGELTTFTNEQLTVMRTNLRNALADKTMTWPTFLKGIRFFQTKRLCFEIEGVQAGTNKKIKSSVMVYLTEAERKLHGAEYADQCLFVVLRNLFKEVGIVKLEGVVWEEYVDAFVKRESSLHGDDAEDKKHKPGSSLRTKLKKKFTREAMTWRSCFTGLRFLQFSTATITTTIYPEGKPALVQDLEISVDEDFNPEHFDD